MKKIVSVLTAVLLLAMFVLPGGVFAAGKPTFNVSTVSANAGEKAEVKISLKNNPGIVSAKLSVSFDGDLTLGKITYGSDFEEKALQPSSLKSPVTLNWVGGITEFKKDGDFATLTFSVSKTAKAGKHEITVSYDKEDVFDINEKDVEFTVENGAVTVAGEDLDVTASETDAATATGETGILTTGENTAGEGSGDYTGGDVYFDDEGNVTKVEEDGGVVSESSGECNTWLWVIIAAVVVIGGGCAAFLIYKKKKTNKPEPEE